MNQTEQLFTYILAFAVGRAFAYAFKNFTTILERFGYLLCIIIGLPTVMVLILAGAMIADVRSISLSLVFLGGFILGMVKRNG